MALTKTPIELSSTPSIVDGGNATAITIDSNEDVTLAGTLNVTGDGDDIIVNSSDYELVLIGNRGSSGANLDKGYIRMKSESTNTIVLDTEGPTYFNGGNVGIGTDSPTTLTEIRGTVPTLTLSSSESKTWSNGDDIARISFFSRDGSGVGAHETGFILNETENSGASLSGALVFGVSDYNTAAAEAMRIDHDGNVDIASGHLSLADGYGIDFSASGNVGGMTAEILDDYEEGTWTPNIIRNDGSTAATFTASSAYSTYTKVGRLVFLKAFFTGVSDGSSNGSSYWRINYAGTMIGYNGLTGADGVYIGDAGGNLILTNGASAYTGSLGSNKEFMLMFVYETNS